MRFTSPSRTIPSICLAIYGCGQLDRVADFINNSGEYVEDGVTFTPGMIAGQYAFEQVKLDRKGYDTRRLQKYLSFLADAGELRLHSGRFGHEAPGNGKPRPLACYSSCRSRFIPAPYSRLRR